MFYHFHSSLHRITKAVRIQPYHFWVSKKRLSCFLAAFLENHWIGLFTCTMRGGGRHDNVTLPVWLGTRNCLRLRQRGLNPMHLVRCLFLLSPPFLCVAYSCAVVDEKRSHHWCDTTVIGKQLFISNDKNRVRWVVLGLLQDGACTDLVENLSVNSLKGDLWNATPFNPPLFSLHNIFNRPAKQISVSSICCQFFWFDYIDSFRV